MRQFSLPRRELKSAISSCVLLAGLGSVVVVLERIFLPQREFQAVEGALLMDALLRNSLFRSFTGKQLRLPPGSLMARAWPFCATTWFLVF